MEADPPSDLVDALGSVAFFAGPGRKDLLTVVKLGQELSFRPGEKVVEATSGVLANVKIGDELEAKRRLEEKKFMLDVIRPCAAPHKEGVKKRTQAPVEIPPLQRAMIFGLTEQNRQWPELVHQVLDGLSKEREESDKKEAQAAQQQRDSNRSAIDWAVDVVKGRRPGNREAARKFLAGLSAPEAA